MTNLSQLQSLLSNQPPFNIEKHTQGYTLVLVVPGYLESELDVQITPSCLKVNGVPITAPPAPPVPPVPPETEDPLTEAVPKTYTHRGWTKSPFSHEFALTPDVVVKSAALAHGLLTFELCYVDPNAPQRFRIHTQ